MVCLIPRPSPQALFDRNRDSFSANVLGGSPVIPESNEWYVVALNYARDEEFYAISEQQWKERDPRYACCDNLIAMAAVDGVYPYPATGAEGYAIISGTAGTRLPSSLEITADNQRNYRTVGKLPTYMPADGVLTVRVRDISPGAAGSGTVVTTASLTSATTGLVTAVTICGNNICGGRDAEACEAFRTRYLLRKQYRPNANQAWAQEKLLTWPCATRVLPRGGECCKCMTGDECGCKTCGTGLNFHVMFDGTFPCGIAPANILQEIQDWFFGSPMGFGSGEAPIGICGSIVPLKECLVDVNIDIADKCPTVSQTNLIREQILDLFYVLQPSSTLHTRQLEAIVAGVVGGDANIAARILPVTVDTACGTVDSCGNYIMRCDTLACIRNLTFSGPQGSTKSQCA